MSRVPREGDIGFVGPPRPPASDVERGFTSKNVAGLFGVIIICILAIAIVRILSGRNIITFTGLLEQLSHAPTIPTNWLSTITTNFGETFPWGFQWLGSAIDFFVDIFAFGMYTGTAALNFLSFAFYFLRWLFV